MPSWSAKDRRKYEHIKESSLERGVPEDRAQEIAGRTQDHAEGVAAFGEKREPRFVGR